ncbi:MAG: TIGR00730 family Rossman fold protein [Flavobacteriaceae bacterium]|nr:MAG: TIGR00730 family Rossman fold protein [Flavobacteriaceae bacterium]
MDHETEEKLRENFRQKTWSEIKSNDSWALFKIMGEIVHGFESMAKIGPCVSIFGSARTQENNPYYSQGIEIAKLLTQNGFGVITGGGPGIMEAANKGAKLGGGKSVGLSINLPFEASSNAYVDKDYNISFDYFFTRKLMFIKYAQGFVVLPGGLGTLDELFEALTLIQTKKIAKFPIVLVGKDYWAGLLDWMKKSMLEDQKNINLEDFSLFHLVDTPKQAVEIIVNFYKEFNLQENF